MSSEVLVIYLFFIRIINLLSIPTKLLASGSFCTSSLPPPPGMQIGSRNWASLTAPRTTTSHHPQRRNLMRMAPIMLTTPLSPTSTWVPCTVIHSNLSFKGLLGPFQLPRTTLGEVGIRHSRPTLCIVWWRVWYQYSKLFVTEVVLAKIVLSL